MLVRRGRGGRAGRPLGRPPKSEARDTEQEILDAALDVFSVKGFHGTSLKEIAAAVGIRDSAIYHYFTSKEALFDAIVAKRPEGLTEARRALLEAPIVDVRALLERVGGTILARFRTDYAMKVLRILLADGGRLHPAGQVDLIERLGLEKTLVTLMERLVTEGWLAPARPQMLVAEFMAPFLMLLFSRAVRPNYALAKDEPAFLREHLDLFLRGALAPGSENASFK